MEMAGDGLILCDNTPNWLDYLCCTIFPRNGSVHLVAIEEAILNDSMLGKASLLFEMGVDACPEQVQIVFALHMIVVVLRVRFLCSG